MLKCRQRQSCLQIKQSTTYFTSNWQYPHWILPVQSADFHSAVLGRVHLSESTICRRIPWNPDFQVLVSKIPKWSGICRWSRSRRTARSRRRLPEIFAGPGFLLEKGHKTCFRPVSKAMFYREQLQIFIFIGITYLWKEVFPQCASLTWGLTLSYEMLCSYGESYIRWRLLKLCISH